MRAMIRLALTAVVVAGTVAPAWAGPTPEQAADVVVNLSILQNNCGRTLNPPALKAYLAEGNMKLDDLMTPIGVHNDVYVARLQAIAADLKKQDGQTPAQCEDLPGTSPYDTLVQ